MQHIVERINRERMKWRAVSVARLAERYGLPEHVVTEVARSKGWTLQTRAGELWLIGADSPRVPRMPRPEVV